MVHFTRACKTLLSENNKTRLTFEKQQEKNKNIICRPWSVRIEKNCALGLQHGPRPAASGRTQDLWHSFSQYGPPGRQIIYIYLISILCFVKDGIDKKHSSGISFRKKLNQGSSQNKSMLSNSPLLLIARAPLVVRTEFP